MEIDNRTMVTVISNITGLTVEEVERAVSLYWCRKTGSMKMMVISAEEILEVTGILTSLYEGDCEYNNLDSFFEAMDYYNNADSDKERMEILVNIIRISIGEEW